MSAAFPAFRPSFLLRGGHAMTIGSYLVSRRFRSTAETCEEERVFRVDAENRVMGRCHWQANRIAAPTLLLVHGLTGSARSGYMIGTADKAFSAGFNVVRLNLRNCDGTEHLAGTLYHSGMDEDVACVARELVERDGCDRVFLAGFSMGGNIVLRFAARLPADLAPHVLGVAAVSPALDLAKAVDNIDAGLVNLVYRQSFLRDLRGLVRRRAALTPGRYDLAGLRGVRTIRQFDDRFTAKDFGFGDADTYYRECTALPLLDRLAVPTLIVQSEDDPLVPVHQLRVPAIAQNPNIDLLLPRHGGHCAFVGQRPAVTAAFADADRYWAENRVVQFFLSSAPGETGRPS